MANGNDDSRKDDPKGSEKPISAKANPKKPSQIIDLKATEVEDPKGAKPSEKENRDKLQRSKPNQKRSLPHQIGKANSKKTGKHDAAKPSVPGVGASDGGKRRVGTGTHEPGMKHMKSAAANKNNMSKPSIKNVKDEANAAMQASNGHSARRSGGGIFWFFTHVVASVLGGLLVLFGARPIEKEFDLSILPQIKIPAQIEERLAALEKRPTLEATTIVKDLDSQINELRAQLTTSDEVLAKVTDFDRRLKQITAEKARASEADEQLKTIGKRITQLELIIDNINLTDIDGQPTSLGSMASLSGKLSDVESSLRTDIAQLRKSVVENIETQISEIAQVSAAAQSGIKRTDKELAQFSNAAAQLELRLENIRLTQKRINDATRVIREKTASLQVDLDSIKGDVKQQLERVARPQDIKVSIAPIAQKLETLQNDMLELAKSERNRKASAQRIVMALELGNLKRALRRGEAYESELSEVKKITGSSVNLLALEKFQTIGVPTISSLQQEFSKLAYVIIGASEKKEDGNLMDRIVSGAKSLVRVRRTDFPPHDASAEATVARIEAQLKLDDIAGAIEEAKNLPNTSTNLITDWMHRLKARAEIDQAIVEIEKQLKSSLVTKFSGKKD